MQKKTGSWIYTRRQVLNSFNSLTAAIYLSCQGINLILQAIVPGFSSLGLSAVFILCFILMLFGIREISLRRILYLCPVVILLFFLFTSILFPGKSAVGIVQLLTYSILPFILVQLEFDLRSVVKWTLIIFSPTIFFRGTVFAHNYHGGISMGVSYAFLPAVICALVYLFCYMRYEKSTAVKLIYFVLCLEPFYFFYEMMFYGSRGPALCVLCFIAFLIFFKREKETDEYKNRSILLFVIIIGIVAVVMFFGDSILSTLNGMLTSHGLNIKFISKSLTLSQDESGILNGRGYIYAAAIRGILKSPIWGNGLDMFMTNTGYVYPHNLILQLLYDGGILLFLITIIPMVFYSVKLFRTHKYKDLMEWACLFCISVPGALFSGDLWEKYTFWFFLAYCIVRAQKLSDSAQVLEEGTHDAD